MYVIGSRNVDGEPNQVSAILLKSQKLGRRGVSVMQAANLVDGRRLWQESMGSRNKFFHWLA